MMTLPAKNILEFEDNDSITEEDGEVTVVAVADSTKLTEAEYNVTPDLDQVQPDSGEGELPRGLAFDVQDVPVLLEEGLIVGIIGMEHFSMQGLHIFNTGKIIRTSFVNVFIL